MSVDDASGLVEGSGPVEGIGPVDGNGLGGALPWRPRRPRRRKRRPGDVRWRRRLWRVLRFLVVLIVVSIASVTVGEFLGVPNWMQHALTLLVVTPLLRPRRVEDDLASEESSPDETPADQPGGPTAHETAVADLLAHTPALDRRSLRPLLWTAVIFVPLAPVLMTAFVVVSIHPPHHPYDPPEWFFRFGLPIALVVIGYWWLIVPPRQYLQGRGIVAAAQAGTNPWVVAVVVGEDGEEPVLLLLDGSERFVVLRQEAKAVAALDQGDLVVLEGELSPGHLVAVSADDRRGWTRVRRLTDATGKTNETEG